MNSVGIFFDNEEFEITAESPVAAGGDPAVVITAKNNPDLSLILVSKPGGLRMFLWPKNQAVPKVPHTNIDPTFAIMGDAILGDSSIIMTNPVTWNRVEANLPVSAVWNLFNGRTSTDGAGWSVYPKGVSGDPESGSFCHIACGYDDGMSGNAHRFFVMNQGTGLLNEIARIKQSGFHPLSDNTMALASVAQRLSGVTSSKFVQAGAPEAHNLCHSQTFPVSCTSWQTKATISLSSVTGAYCMAQVSLYAQGHTGSKGNGAIAATWYIDVNNAAPTAIQGTDATSGNAPQVRLLANAGAIDVQVQSYDGTNSFNGSLDMIAHLPAPTGGLFTWSIS